MGVHVHRHAPGRRAVLPQSRRGWLAVALAAANAPLVMLWSVFPYVGALPGFVAGAAGGVVAILALRRGDRAVLVALAVVPLALVVLFVLAELSIGHG